MPSSPNPNELSKHRGGSAGGAGGGAGGSGGVGGMGGVCGGGIAIFRCHVQCRRTLYERALPPNHCERGMGHEA